MTRRAIALEAAASVAWAIYEPALRTILEIAARETVDLKTVADWKGVLEGAPAGSIMPGEPNALAARRGAWKEGTDEVQVRDGIGIVPVIGPIFRRANMMTNFSGATALSRLARDFTATVEDPAVKHILLDVDGPGGEANGVGEFAAMVRAAGATKPITAYVGGTAASASYWIASAAGRIVMAPTAMVGSIGVVMAYRDTRERDAKAGVTTHEFVSSVSPLKRADPSTDDGRAAIQALVDRLAEEFVGAVAANRGVDTRTVAADFGRGGMLIGGDAVAAGMADALGSFEGLLSELSADGSRSFFMSSRPAAAAPETQHMSDKNDPEAGKDTLAAGPAAAPSGPAVDPNALKAEGAASATARIRSIFQCEEAKGREAMAHTLAFETDMSVEQACKVLASAPAAQPAATDDPTGFKAAMGKVPNPKVGADGGTGSEDDDPVKALLGTAKAMGAAK